MNGSPHDEVHNINIDKGSSGGASSSPTSTTTDDILEEEGDYLEGHEFPQGGGELGSSTSPLIISSSSSSPAGHDHQNQMMKKKKKKSWEITHEEEEEEERDDEEAIIATARNYYYGHSNFNSNHNYLYSSNSERLSSTTKEIVAVGDEEVQGEGSSLFSFDLSSSFHHQHRHGDGDGEGDGDAVYVAVSSSTTSASMDAVEWTLNQAALVNPSSTTVCLVHVFPQIKHIPTPLGMMAVSQVNPEQKKKYIAQEREKRKEFLTKFINACSTAKVKVDTILIESDMEAQAILDLIPVLNITELVLPITKLNLRKMRSKGASGSVVDQIVKAAPESCEVKIVCEGKQVHDPFTHTHSPRANKYTPRPSAPEGFFRGCGSCFKTKFPNKKL